MRFARSFHWLAIFAITAMFAARTDSGNTRRQQCVAMEPSSSDREEPETKEAKELHDLEIRSATILHRLVRMNLEAAEELNQKVPNSISKTSMDRMKQIVEIAEERLNAMKARSPHEKLWVIRAQYELQLAETNLQRGVELSKHAGALNDRGVERLRLLRDLARVNLERAQTALASPSPVADMRWQLDRLNDTLGDLTNSVESITSRR